MKRRKWLLKADEFNAALTFHALSNRTSAQKTQLTWKLTSSPSSKRNDNDNQRLAI